MNHSPWIAQLKKNREESVLSSAHQADIVVVGGGIAGAATAFFLLANTGYRVTLIEAYRVAHGATGHNAGQLVTYFERSFSDLVREYGLKLAAEAQSDIDGTWSLLDEIRKKLHIRTSLNLFVGYAGFASTDVLLLHLENNLLRKKAGLLTERFRVANIPSVLAALPEKYKGLYSVIAHEDVLSLLETNDESYIAALSSQKGVMNSALFSEEVIGALLGMYADRFTLFERSPVQTIRLKKDGVICEVGTHQVSAKRVVLCTNGFENFMIMNEVGPEIDTRFHEEVYGTIGYMAGFLEPLNRPPTAVSYLSKTSVDTNDPYFYITRRPYEFERGEVHNLICVGGPESYLEEKKRYNRSQPFPPSAKEEIARFLRNTLPRGSSVPEFAFTWHGLMGYTRSGVRLIGADPANPALLYNLGCNGVGILPSIVGGKKISAIVRGEPQRASIFDPFR